MVIGFLVLVFAGILVLMFTTPAGQKVTANLSNDAQYFVGVLLGK